MLEKVRAILAERMGVDEEDVVAEASLRNDLGLDSLDLFELLMNLEEEYGIRIDPDTLAGLSTVGDVLKYLEDTGAAV